MQETWTGARIEMLKAMWADNKSAQDIATELALTRGSVVGKLDRLGLKREKNTRVSKASPAQKPGVSTRPPMKRASLAPGTRKASGPTEPIVRALPELVIVPQPEPIAPALSIVATEQPVEGVALDELKSFHCRWPVDVPAGPMRYCGAPKDPGIKGPYCLCHARRAFPQIATREGEERARRQMNPALRPRVAA